MVRTVDATAYTYTTAPSDVCGRTRTEAFLNRVFSSCFNQRESCFSDDLLTHAIPSLNLNTKEHSCSKLQKDVPAHRETSITDEFLPHGATRPVPGTDFYPPSAESLHSSQILACTARVTAALMIVR
jgi:hypothetical protein